MLGKLTEVLAGSGVELSEEELLDALWLARTLPQGTGPLARKGVHVEARRPSDRGPERSAAPSTGQDTAGSADRPDPETSDRGPVERPLQAAPRTGDDREQHAHHSSAHGVRVPDTPQAAARALRLGRALRPLRQRFPDNRRPELDLARTVEAMADSGLPEIALRPSRTRWLSLALVVDDGLSMVLWQRLASDVRRLMERAGAFRDVRIHGLDTRSAEAPRLSARPYPSEGPFRPTTSLYDPSGDTLVLVVSDGVGDAWRDGRMHRAIDRWARRGPTAIIHALPTRLWANSGVSARSWQVTTRRRGGPATEWRVADPVLPPDLVTFDAVPVPVLEPSPGALAEWARLIASPGATTTLPLWNGGPEPIGRAFAGPGREDEAEAVLRFRSAASPEAYRLAAHLAAVAPVPVPVMRLFRTALGAPTDSGHLAEVFLGGLMHQVRPEADQLPHHRLYDFPPETRRILLSALAPKELLRTTRAVTDLLEAGIGRSPDFAAWVGHPDGTALIGDDGRPFGSLTDRLLTRLGVSPAGPSAAGPGTAAPSDVHGVQAPPIPTGWSPLSPADPRTLGPFRLYARYDQGWAELAMYLGLDEHGETVSLRAPAPLGDLDLEQSRDLIRTETECLQRMGGVFAPKLRGADPGYGQEPPWVASACRWRSGVPRPELAPNVQALLEETEEPIDVTLFHWIGYNLACAIRRAHGLGLVHGSLTPKTVLITDHDVQLVGWITASRHGVHSRHREDFPRDFTFRAPEAGRPALSAYGGVEAPTAPGDMFSVGAVLIAAATGRWSTRPQTEVRANLRAAGISDAVADALRACLHPDPEDRPTAAELVDAFQQALLTAGAPDRLDLARAQEMVSRYRLLTDREPETFGPALAETVAHLGNLLGTSGRLEEACAALDEAAWLYQELPDEFRPNLARVLNNLSVRLGELNRLEEALTAIQEAADLLLALNQERSLPPLTDGLALTLNNLSNRLGAAGRNEEALAAIVQSVGLYRSSAQRNAQIFHPGLAQALNNLSNRLGEAGRNEEALAAIDEATVLHRDLDHSGAKGARSALASCLSNRAVRLAALGRLEEARTTLTESTRIRESLSAANPEAYEADLAQSQAIATWLSDLSRDSP
ncbi:SAV_2336 N-terminal domain-related protein [Kitasatospora sp. NPDC051170]|uniref:SAV_2336 N-terminal domain-related protein n=1 Tax=Kitasatospora sp. NPDC051170 TaxID=3364056 RepID=UPI0037A11DB2